MTGRSFGLFLARDLSPPAADDSWDVNDVADRAAHSSFDLRAVVKLDDEWKVQTVTGDIDALSVLREGTTLSALTDPGDLDRLLFAFAGATTHADRVTAIHLSSGSSRYAVDLDVAMVRQGSWHLRLGPVHGREIASTPRASELERHLRRIAAEVEASGILERTRTVSYSGRLPQMGSLSTRQSEVLSRLVNGERVPTIAKELFVSQSTVRDHLSAIFERFGVHSQAELLALLRGVEETSG
jgi:DNA-binding CsgD family transcriptional regulator